MTAADLLAASQSPPVPVPGLPGVFVQPPSLRAVAGMVEYRTAHSDDEHGLCNRLVLATARDSAGAALFADLAAVERTPITPSTRSPAYPLVRDLAPAVGSHKSPGRAGLAPLRVGTAELFQRRLTPAECRELGNPQSSDLTLTARAVALSVCDRWCQPVLTEADALDLPAPVAHAIADRAARHVHARPTPARRS